MKCAEKTCQTSATLHFIAIENRRVANHQNLCKQHGNACLDSLLTHSEIATQSPPEKPTEVSFEFEILVYDDDIAMAWIILRESIAPAKGNRCLTLKAGYNEASVINSLLFGTESLRPITYEAFVNAIHLLGGEIAKVVVDDYDKKEELFVAKLEIYQNGRKLILDLRPSDALALALVANVPVFAGPAVMQKLFSGTAT